MKWFFFVMFLSRSLTAYELVQWFSQPQEVRLATPVELVIELALAQEDEAELLLPWPESDEFWISDLKTELTHTTQEARQLKLFITVSFYRLGKVMLQGLRFANFELEPLELEVLSFISEEKAEFQFEEEPQLLPGTINMLIIGTLIIVFSPLLLLFFWFFIFPKLKLLWRRKWHLLYAYGKFCYTLFKLEKSCLKEQPATVYRLMNAALRSYLGSLFKNPCQSYTAEEIKTLLAPYFKEVEALFVILKKSDEVRFSSISCAANHCANDLKGLKQLVRLMHKRGQRMI